MIGNIAFVVLILFWVVLGMVKALLGRAILYFCSGCGKAILSGEDYMTFIETDEIYCGKCSRSNLE